MDSLTLYLNYPKPEISEPIPEMPKPNINDDFQLTAAELFNV